MKRSSRWYSPRVGQEVQLVRWGELGKPVLVYPTAGGDAEEVERFQLVNVTGSLMARGRVKLYSCDSVAGRAWLSGHHSPAHCAWVQNRFDSFVYHEVVPAIRQDCRSPEAELLVAGASIGAFNALASICRHPDVFSHAICMSGTYDLEPKLHGESNLDFYYSSPLHFLPNLTQGEQLARLRRRFVVLAFAQGRWEDPQQTWRAAHVLGAKGIPNRVDPWGPEFDHDWPTWRAMLPRYLEELT